jgi:hypothetical protein
MIKSLIRRRLNAFERGTGYDATYMREILDASLPAFRAFSGVQAMSHHCEDMPAGPLHACKIAAMVAQDCGPCVQLSVTFAEQAGLDPALIRAMLTGDLDAMGADCALTWRYARAVSARDPEADVFREQIERRWGRRGLMTLALQIAVAGTYPAMKYALGHGQACSRIRVGAEQIAPRLSVDHAVAA